MSVTRWSSACLELAVRDFAPIRASRSFVGGRDHDGDTLPSGMLPPLPRGPIDAVNALERVEAERLSLLSRITADEWDAQTIVPGWRVRHVAGHLLDTATRTLAIVRDGFSVERPATNAPEDVR